MHSFRTPAIATILLAGTLWAACAQVGSAPTLMFATVLNGVKLDPASGALNLYNIQALNLPTPPAGGYSPDAANEADRLWAVLSSADGAEVARYKFYCNSVGRGAWLLETFWVTPAATGETEHHARINVPAGDYTLDFYLQSGKFYSFPFRISQEGDGCWFLDGAWEDWGYLLYSDANPEQSLVWKLWLRNRQCNQTREAKVALEIIRDADGKRICTNRPDITYTLRPEWVRYEWDLIHPMQGTSGGAMFLAKELLAVNGNYTLKVSVGGAHYGTWKFAVAGNHLVYGPRSNSTTADPLTFVAGGVDAWWYERDRVASAGTQAAEQAPIPPQVIPGSTPITVNGHTMVPLRSIFEWLGANVTYIPQALSVVATRGDTTILMRMDENEATVNARRVPMAQPPLQRDGVTYVPLRLVAEAFGCQVAVDGGTITITDGARVGIVR